MPLANPVVPNGGIAMSDSGSYIYYIAPSQQKVARSVNGGTSFFATTCPESTFAYFDLACSGSGAVVAVSGSSAAGTAAYISSDYGVTWFTSALFSAITSFSSVGVSNDGSVVVISGTSGVFVSTDSGASFTKRSSSSSYSEGTAMSLDGTRIARGFTSGSMQFSADRGATFNSFTSGTSANYQLGLSAMNTLRSLSMSEDGTRMIMTHGMNSERGLYLTTNSRASWTMVTNDPAYAISGNPCPYKEVCMSPDGLTIWVSTDVTGAGLFKSSDGGGSWTVSVARKVGYLLCSRDATKVMYYSFFAPIGLFTAP